MKLSELGEFAFIDRFSPGFGGEPDDAILGIGDDCAVLPRDNRSVTLITTDMLIEDSHFLRERIPPEDLGYKSLAVNLSDIAAMGGKPEFAFLSLGMPGNTEVEWMDRFFIGLQGLCRETEVRLLGGDTTRSGKHLVINIAVIGRALKKQVKYRSAARMGDVICVTGSLGDSAAGLRLILEQLPAIGRNHTLIKAHNRPRAHLAEGAWLAGQKKVHAMMDVSDGIDSDLHRIMERSDCGAAVELSRLPCSKELTAVCKKNGWNLYELAAAGGEDYCLLCTIDPEACEGIRQDFREIFGRDLVAVGTITEGRTLEYHDRGAPVKLARHGFDHFA